MQALRERLAIKPEHLRRRLDPATLPFQTTAEVAPVKTAVGQPRAAGAIAFALEVGPSRESSARAQDSVTHAPRSSALEVTAGNRVMATTTLIFTPRELMRDVI